jgi:glycosyltransferase involved in cell wall biosynthesis
LVARGVPGTYVDGVRTVGLPRAGNRLVRLLLVAPLAVLKAARERADVVHLHDPELLPWGWLLRLSGQAVIFDMHEYLPGAIRSKGWIPMPLRRVAEALARAAERIFLWNMPTIFAEDSYREHYPWISQHETVLNLPDAEDLLSRPISSLASRRVVYVGRVTEERGSLVILDALKILRERGEVIEYLCIGPASDAERRKIDQKIVENQLTTVELAGYLPQPDAVSRIQDGSLGLAVLKKTPNYERSYPTKMFEYMALGIPVVTSNFDLYRGVVEGADCGVCVDPDSPRELADVIDRVLSDPVRARQMGENGRRAVATRFNWGSELGKLESFYARVAR